MFTGLNDIEIIGKVLNGEQQAYSLLVSRYQNYVFTLALRFTKNREDAEEVSQDIDERASFSVLLGSPIPALKSNLPWP